MLPPGHVALPRISLAATVGVVMAGCGLLYDDGSAIASG
jgi:hypothetical protein